MTSARHASGGAALRNGRLLVLVAGRSGRPTHRPMPDSDQPSPRLTRELAGFLAAVFVGSLGGLLTARLLAGPMGTTEAGTLAIAAGTTLTAATHARLIHGLPYRALVPRVLLAAPLAYLVMRGVHVVLGR
jgi:hypothetical protein